jgi:DNA polymerase III epsilon subunit-like protein
MSNATPLIALNAVAIDTETAGLDSAKARIVEITAVRLVGGGSNPRKSFDTLSSRVNRSRRAASAVLFRRVPRILSHSVIYAQSGRLII